MGARASLPSRVKQSSTAKHVAVIMDGNGRWAKSRGKARLFGHRQGVKAVRRIVEHSTTVGLQSLTLYAFSSENWRRPKAEVKLLFELLSLSISEQLADLHENNIRLCVLGDLDALPGRLVKKIKLALNTTQHNTGLTLNIALNYGARWELAQAARQLADACQRGEISPTDIDEDRFASQLTTAGQAELDLLIRTGGERRLSNFLLWQSAYAELYFCDTYWPDFDEACMDEALAWFASRKRRFGKTDEQLEEPCGD
jgi:undecaprenyl diphosphate synthase